VIGPSTGVLENAEKTQQAFPHLPRSFLPSDTEKATLPLRKLVGGEEGRGLGMVMWCACVWWVEHGRGVCWVSGEWWLVSGWERGG